VPVEADVEVADVEVADVEVVDAEDDDSPPVPPVVIGVGPGHPAMVAAKPPKSAAASPARTSRSRRGREPFEVSFILSSTLRRRRERKPSEDHFYADRGR
jgi:hypothetical protein